MNTRIVATALAPLGELALPQSGDESGSIAVPIMLVIGIVLVIVGFVLEMRRRNRR